MRYFNKTFLKELFNRIKVDDVPSLSAELAYFFLLSLFPLLIFLVTLLPYLPITEDQLLRFFEVYAPESAMDLITERINDVLQKDGKLLSFGIIATLWSASNGINAIVKAFNKAYDVKETRSFIVARGMAVVLTLAMIFVFVVAILLPVLGQQIGVFLFSYLGLSEQFITIWNLLRWPVSVAILFIVFIGLYWIAPNKKFRCKSALPGAVFATVGWIAASLGFSYYVGNFGNYTATYGSIGAIIVLMLWFYITGFIIIIGGEINAIMSDEKEDC